MLFGIVGFIVSIIFFLMEYGKWRRKALAISFEQKIIRSISFVLMVCVFSGLFFFGWFDFVGMKKDALTDFLITMILFLVLIINLLVDLSLTRKRKFFLKKDDYPKL